jgi:excisionase family DNA binding protein
MTIYRMIGHQKLRAHYTGQRLRISEEELERFEQSSK